MTENNSKINYEKVLNAFADILKSCQIKKDKKDLSIFSKDLFHQSIAPLLVVSPNSIALNLTRFFSYKPLSRQETNLFLSSSRIFSRIVLMLSDRHVAIMI